MTTTAQYRTIYIFAAVCHVVTAPARAGAVRRAYESGGTRIVDYTYGSWGDVTGESVNASSLYTIWANQNPIRYNGQYLDAESGMYYLRARYYDPNVCRFITEDPIRDGMNWYAYAGNNPVMFVDPLGLRLVLGGTDEERQTILNHLNVLSRDVLKYDDNDGHVYIAFQNMNTEDRPVGTDLIYQLICEDNTCMIVLGVDNKTLPMDYELASTDGTDTKVFFNPNKEEQIAIDYNITKNRTITEKSILYISLGHELIHSLRSMRGHRKDRSISGNYINGSNRICPQEELDTIGINYINNGRYVNAASWYFTENSLRKEHGLSKRIMW